MMMQSQRPAGAADKARDAAAPGPTDAIETTGRRVRVWDLPVRLFHWLAASLVLAAYLTWRLNWMVWHAWAGDALLTLLLFRLLWGFFGSDTARFSHFLASPERAARHLAHIFRRERDLQVGHNPAGGWMVVLLLALLLAQTLTGLFVDNEVANQGPLSELLPAAFANLMNSLHDVILWDAVLAAAALHILAVLVYGVAKRHNLLLPMITGSKILPQGVPSPRMTGLLRALLLLACAAAAAAVLANYL